MSDLSTLKAHIKTGNLSSFYVFTGPEVKVQDIYIQQMAKVSNATIKKPDSITELMTNIRSISFLKSRHIYVLRECKEFLSDDKFQMLITQINTFSDDIVVFIYSTIDKRSKIYKSMQDNIIEFEPLREDILIRYIQKEADLNDTHCRTLIELCDADYSRILLEIDKINTYAEIKKMDANKAMDILVSEGTIYTPPKDAVFDFVDAVLRYKPKTAFKLLRDSYLYGEATMVLLSNLYSSAKQLLQYQTYKGDNLIQSTGLTPFQVKLASGRTGYYSAGDLVYLMRTVREVERGIKTGEIEEQLAVYYVLVSLWR